MTNTPRRTLTLELEMPDADHVAGRLADSSGRGTDFVGWLGLAGAIEALSDVPQETGAARTAVRHA